MNKSRLKKIVLVLALVLIIQCAFMVSFASAASLSDGYSDDFSYTLDTTKNFTSPTTGISWTITKRDSTYEECGVYVKTVTDPTDNSNTVLKIGADNDADANQRLDNRVYQTITNGYEVVTKMQFMLEDKNSTASFTVKYNHPEGNLSGGKTTNSVLTVKNGVITIGQGDSTTTINAEYRKWYNFVLVVKHGSTSADIYCNNEKVTVDIFSERLEKYDYPCFTCSKSSEEGTTSVIYFDNYSLYESAEPYAFSLKSNAYNLISASSTLTKKLATSAYTVESILASLDVPAGATVGFFDNVGNEITEGALAEGTTYLLFKIPSQNIEKRYYIGVSPSISLSSIYSDYMVLQRGKEIHICGYAPMDNTNVYATLGEYTREAVSANGKFDIVFPAMTATKNLTLKVWSAGSAFEYKNVDIGEVWILAGQSNMDLKTTSLEDYTEYLANVNNFKNMRAYTQNNEAKFEVQKNTVNGLWFNINSGNLSQLSAIGYVMATKLATELDDVTIAILDCAYGGTSIESWLDLDTLKNQFPDDYHNYLAFKRGSTDPNDYLNSPSLNKGYWPAACYNQMIAPITGYTVKGVLWYQGENDNWRPNAAEYPQRYKALTALWRRDFKDAELPFFVFQLSPYGNSAAAPFRNYQYDMCLEDENSYLISTALDGGVFSYGDLQDIASLLKKKNFVHTARKSEVAYRVANYILAEIYDIDKDSVYKAPEIVSTSVSGSNVTITFDTELMLLWGDKVLGFEVSADNKKWVDATGTVNGSTVTLTSSVASPLYVRYQHEVIVLTAPNGQQISIYNVNNEFTINELPDGGYELVAGGHHFIAGENEAIFNSLGGNLTNASGYPMPAFQISVGK